MSILSRTFGSLRKRVVAAAIVGLAAFLPIAVNAANLVNITANTTVSNATQNAGSYNWASSASAKYNEVVAIQVVYNNTEAPTSNKVANDLHVKINIPSTAGKTQTVTTKTSASNSNTVNGSATVNLDRADAYLQYIPGTATWKHATAANADLNGSPANVVTEHVSDDVVLAANGINLGNENPCQAGSIVVQARVMVPGLTVDKYVRLKGQTDWKTSISAKVGDTVQYEIAYHNTGNTVQNDVEFRDQLPKGISYVAGSTKLKSGNYPNGLNVTSDAIVTDGITTGDYAPGAAGYVMFEAKISGENLVCGANTLRNIGYVQPSGMNYYYNTADVTVNKDCEKPKEPVYSCNLLNVDKIVDKDRTVTAYFKDGGYTAENGASLTMVKYDFGDGNTLTTDKLNVTHQYAKDGTYNVTASLTFRVNDKDVTGITSEGCAKSVSFTPPTTPPTTPPELPNTGAGSVVGIFGAVTVLSAIGYRLFLGRKVRA